MSKFYSSLGTDPNLVYWVMGAIIVAFVVEGIIVLLPIKDEEE